jgi:hypothetical protein
MYLSLLCVQHHPSCIFLDFGDGQISYCKVIFSRGG